MTTSSLVARALLGLALLFVPLLGCSPAAAVRPQPDAGLASDAARVDVGPADDAALVIDAASVDGAAPLPAWLLTVGNEDDGAGGYTHRLVELSLVPGELGTVSHVLCDNLVFGGPDVPNDVVSALTFHEGVLYSNGASGSDPSQPAAALYRIDICHCTATRVGDFGADITFVGAITSYPGRGIYGMAASDDSMFTIDPETGAGTVVSPVTIDVAAADLTWSGPRRDTLWFITSVSDTLFELDDRGQVLTSLPLHYDFNGLGMAYHPGLDRLFACSNGKILEIDTTTGDVEVGADTGLSGCASLAAPFGDVDCVF
ncbi:MAG: hypothetical protein U0234_32065 [Sandaracinus sp.]